MRDPNRDQFLTFVASTTEAEQLIDYANGLNLVPHSVRFLDPDVVGTFPETRQGYLGKEHIRLMGDELGINRMISTMVLTQLSFPLAAGEDGKPEKLDPQELGIVRKTRAEVGMPPYEGGGSTYNQAPERLRIHLGYSRSEAARALHVVNNTVLQADSMVMFGCDLATQAKAIFDPIVLSTVARMLPRLEELPVQ